MVDTLATCEGQQYIPVQSVQILDETRTAVRAAGQARSPEGRCIQIAPDALISLQEFI